jgi:hypothetical protein
VPFEEVWTEDHPGRSAEDQSLSSPWSEIADGDTIEADPSFDFDVACDKVGNPTFLRVFFNEQMPVPSSEIEEDPLQEVRCLEGARGLSGGRGCVRPSKAQTDGLGRGLERVEVGDEVFVSLKVPAIELIVKLTQGRGRIIRRRYGRGKREDEQGEENKHCHSISFLDEGMEILDGG